VHSPAGTPQRAAAADADEAPSTLELVAGYGKWVVRAVVFGALALAAIVIVPRFLKGREAAAVWDKAVAAHNAGRFDEAIALYKDAKAKAPADYTDLQQSFPVEIAKSYRAAGAALLEADKAVEAAKIYQDWIDTAPESAAAGGAYFEAARCYQRATIQNPALRETALRYAREALAKGGGEFSRQEIERFIEVMERKKTEP